MSQSHAQNSILSREELGALLDTMAENTRNEQARQAIRPLGVAQATGSRSELLRIAKVFAEEQGRGLSTLHETTITLRLSQWEEISLGEFASAMLEDDRIARISLGGGHADAAMLMSRPLVFGWMMLAFGAKPGVGGGPLPDRPYTRIEERFMRGAAAELAHTLARSMGSVRTEDVRVESLEAPASLLDRTPRQHMVVSFDVDGIGPLSRLRLAIPTSIVEGGSRDIAPEQIEARSGLEHELLDVPVDMRVTIGSAELSLSQVASLEPGSEIQLEPNDGGQLVVHVGDQAKFRAERGSLDQKLAIRILEAL